MFDASFTANDLGSPDGCGVLKLKGVISIESGSELKDALVDALAHSRSLVIDLGEVTEIDESGLQLLCAAHKSAIMHNKSLSLAHDDSPIFSETALNIGFHCSLRTTCIKAEGEYCLWSAPEMACKGGFP